MHPLAENPFFVLELPPSATPMEVERQGKKLLGMLELGLLAAQTFPTPYGPRPRTPERIRAAVQVLLDPARRLPFEPWAGWVPSSSPASAASASSSVSSSVSSSASPTSSSAAPFDANPLLWWQP